MEKKKLNLKNLGKNSSCKEVLSTINEKLKKESLVKVNFVDPCSDESCEKIDKTLPLIRSPFDVYKLNTANNGYASHLTSGKDSNWEVGLGDTTGFNSVSTWVNAYVHKNSAWVASPFNNANWISLYSDAKHSGNIDVYYRIKFNLDSGVDPSSFYLALDFFADNAIHEIYVNGVPQSSQLPQLPQNPSDPYRYKGFENQNRLSTTLSRNWVKCENEIIVHIKSGEKYVGFLVQNSSACLEANVEELKPLIELKWGDSSCDCLETDDYEVFYISVRNPFKNISFSDFKIMSIHVVDEKGNPVALLPNGEQSVELRPAGPYCFGNIEPCNGKIENFVAREFVLFNRGAKPGKYKILIEGICYKVQLLGSSSKCFEIDLCLS